MTQHRVAFDQLGHALLNLIFGDAEGRSQLAGQSRIVVHVVFAEELVQRWVQQTNCHSLASHDSEQVSEVVTLEVDQLSPAAFSRSS